MDQNFVDLRQNHGHSGLDHSFWPSFTDIMMVVVMIFIIASTVLIVRNWELVAELRATLEAERQARQEVTVFQATSRSLEEQLSLAQQELAEERLRNLQLVELTEEQRAQIARHLEQLLVLRTEREQLTGQVETARRQTALLSDQLAQEQSRYVQQQTRYAQLEQEHELLAQEHKQRATRLEELLAALASLEQRQQQSLAELGTLRQDRAEMAQRLTTLETDYTSLEEKYQKLIRPARSTLGKQVVEVLYRRGSGAPQIQLRLPQEESFRGYSASTMHQQLAALKQQHGKDLYVKIVIPKDSGLTYNEAWDFTRNILQRYDYYYQP